MKSSVAGGVRLLSVLPDELPAAIERLQTANRQQLKSQEALYDKLAMHEAAVLASTGERMGAATVVATAVTGWDASGLKKLASAIVARPATDRRLISSESPALIVVARSQDLSFDTGDVLKQLIQRFGGKAAGKGRWPRAEGSPAILRTF